MQADDSHRIVDIIDFDDSVSALRYQPLTNNEQLLIKEIESQDEESGLDDMCDVDKNIIRDELRSLEATEDLKKYCIKICEYYSERVGILMRYIYRNCHTEDSILKSARDKDSLIAKLQREVDDQKMFEHRLKELEIENSQLKKFKARFEEAEQKFRESETRRYSMEKKAAYFKDILDAKDQVISNFSFDDVCMWEDKSTNLLIKLKDKKTDICQEVLNKSQAIPRCVVCQTAPVGAIIKNCNHICLCWACALTLKVCPFDRQPISNIEKIYLP